MSTSASLQEVAILAATLVIVYRTLQMHPYSTLGERLITVIQITKPETRHFQKTHTVLGHFRLHIFKVYVRYCCISDLLHQGVKTVFKSIGRKPDGGQIVKSHTFASFFCSFAGLAMEESSQ